MNMMPRRNLCYNFELLQRFIVSYLFESDKEFIKESLDDDVNIYTKRRFIRKCKNLNIDSLHKGITFTGEEYVEMLRNNFHDNIITVNNIKSEQIVFDLNEVKYVINIEFIQKSAESDTAFKVNDETIIRFNSDGKIIKINTSTTFDII